MGLIEFLVAVLILLIIVYVCHLVIEALALPPAAKQVALLLVAVIALLILLSKLGLLGGLNWH